jgi:hypothetical protein
MPARRSPASDFCGRRRNKFSLAVTGLVTLRSLLEHWKRLVELNPGQFIFEPDRFPWRKRRRIVERRDRHVDRVGIFSVLKKQMRAATCSKRTNAIRMRNLARFTSCYDQIFAAHGSPGNIRRAGAPPAIDAMTIDQRQRLTFQHVSCPAANASTTQRDALAHRNHGVTSVTE